jgi:hypothetical protein
VLATLREVNETPIGGGRMGFSLESESDGDDNGGGSLGAYGKLHPAVPVRQQQQQQQQQEQQQQQQQPEGEPARARRACAHGDADAPSSWLAR